jgi:hypothetical protein
MQDDNWELLKGDAAGQVEYINIENQRRLIEAFVIYFEFNRTIANKEGSLCPNLSVLSELHRVSTLLLSDAPGEVRKEDVVLKRPDGTITFNPPSTDKVGHLLLEFETKMVECWASPDSLLPAAYSLWAINHIHPFSNGNGRTARAFAYTCICIKAGQMLPGEHTVIDQLFARRGEMIRCLEVADLTFKDTGTPDLRPTLMLLFECLQIQLAEFQ